MIEKIKVQKIKFFLISYFPSFVCSPCYFKDWYQSNILLTLIVIAKICPILFIPFLWSRSGYYFHIRRTTSKLPIFISFIHSFPASCFLYFCPYQSYFLETIHCHMSINVFSLIIAPIQIVSCIHIESFWVIYSHNWIYNSNAIRPVLLLFDYLNYFSLYFP